MSASGAEEYLGGLESGRMKKGMVAGYGIYATNRRIIGVKSRKALGKALAGSAFGVIGAYVGAKLSRDESVKMIEELDQKKDFEVARENVSSLELKKPTMWRRGHMIIGLASGEAVKILIADKKVFDRVNTLMQAFRPEVVTVL